MNSWNATLQSLVILFTLASINLASFAQTNFAFEYNTDPIVKIGSTPLKFPWSGGINYGQFSNIDYDFDGDQDLFVFDRSGDEILLFEQTAIAPNSNWEFVPNAHLLFPSDCRYRVALLDYNGDGKNDLFTYGIGGIKVYKNIGNSSIGLQWELSKNLVETNYLGSLTNLYVSSSDIPAYVDVEDDGDIDVLTFHIGGERIEYHQNQSMELYGIPDSLVFVLKNECWGQFREDQNNNNIFLNDTQSPCGTGNIPNPQIGTGPPIKEPIESTVKHSGSSVLALDMNNNGVLDLVLGDVSYPGLTLLTNGGTIPNSNSAMIAQDHNFPSNTTPASMQLFPASYYVDVDNDGLKDLIVAPNAKTISENQKSVLFYKNNGTNTAPNFSYQTNEFLQKEMIDHGFGSIPILFDQNSDGKRDLLTANFFRYKPTLLKESYFLVHRNTGNATTPEFTFLENDFLSLSTLNYGLRAVPTFGDLDNDGDEDLIIGKDNGSLVKYTNTAGAGNPVNFTSPEIVLDNNAIEINVLAYAHPQLFDLDNDGLLDLIIGKKTGEISYYKNIGSSTIPVFSLQSSTLGNVDVSSATDAYAAPHFFRVNDTTHLFVGAYDGQLHYYNNIDDSLATSFTLVSANYLGIDVGLYSSFWVEDIDNDGNLNLFVGQDLGGLSLFEANPNSTAAISENNKELQCVLYPNPTKQQLNVSLETTSPVTIIIKDLNGKVLFEGNETTIDVSSFCNGIYLLQISTNEASAVKRFVKQ
ncbi:MAG: T9SS type A sorting domain-containing protein [Fluviicola sp.]|nr:T9SS type A sorting domain-containing protein [Fluviicola sp.]